MENSMPGSGAVLTKSIGMQPSDYKVGDTVKMVITSYGEFRLCRSIKISTLFPVHNSEVYYKIRK